MSNELLNNLQGAFFDYVVLLSGTRTPAETTAAVKLLNAVLELLKCSGSGDIECVSNVIDDIQSMIEIAKKEQQLG